MKGGEGSVQRRERETAPGVRVEKTTELQFFILAKESNKKSVRDSESERAKERKKARKRVGGVKESSTKKGGRGGSILSVFPRAPPRVSFGGDETARSSIATLRDTLARKWQSGTIRENFRRLKRNRDTIVTLSIDIRSRIT